MKKLLVIAVLGVAVNVAEAKPDKQVVQHIGVGSGAIIGAIAAGPAGAILGAVIGGHYTEKTQLSARVPGLEHDLLQAREEIGVSEQRIARLDRSLFAARTELEQLGAQTADLLLERAAFAGLQMEVMYPTGTSELDDKARLRLQQLGELLGKLPDLTVRLDGYADPRGAVTYNDQLSRQRAESVRDILLASGVSMDRIALYAHGEKNSSAAESDLDAFAMERKVRVRLLGLSDSAQVAQESE